MSAQDRRAEREVADFYDTAQRPPDASHGPLWPRVKRFAAGFASGYAVGKLVRRVF